MNVRIGLTAHSPAWEQLLEQEGATYEPVDLQAGCSPDAFSVVVVTRPLPESLTGPLREYLKGGGAVIGSAAFLGSLGGGEPRKEKLRYIRAEPGDRFASMGLLDVDADCWILREANALRTQDNTFALFAGPWQGGFAVILPFDAGQLVMDDRAASRNFTFSMDRLPAERVSAVGKGALRQLLHAAFEFLHHERDLPYVHRWHFPDGRRNVFAFRIDTDGAPQQDVEDLYGLAREHDVPLTWFLDVGAHEAWLRRFSGMVGQEIGVHCYEHEVLARADVARRNLLRARHAMERVGLRAKGFAAPFGVWSTELARVMDEMGFLYSSEFSFAYDTLPLYPGISGRNVDTLQVPIHPICIGTMVRVGYSRPAMMRYFAGVVARKLQLGEPLFFYHHPAHRRHDVVLDLFHRIKSSGIDALTLGEYAGWWKLRELWKPQITSDQNAIHVGDAVPAAGAERVWLALSCAGGRYALVPPSPTIPLADVQWEERPPASVPADLQGTREFDPRGLLGHVFSTLSRKFR
jgi:hypothetical protein